jgi:general secretion pathway protein F/type IV pilus assembly protein PilC
MTTFTYEAIDLTGNRVQGALDAVSRRAVTRQLSQKSLTPVSIAEQAAASGIFSDRVPRSVICAFYGKLATLLKAGMPLAQSLKLIGDVASNPRFAEILRVIHAEVIDGRSFAECMADYPGMFEQAEIAIVLASLEGAFLADALKELETLTQRQLQLRSRVLGALSYPGFLIAVSSLMFLVLSTLFVPKFEPMFSGLRERGQLPVLTEIMLTGSLWLRDNPLVFAGMSFAAVCGLVVGLRKPGFRRRFLTLCLQLPVLKGLGLLISMGRFSRLLSTLLKNGITLDKGLALCAGASGSPALDDVVLDCALQVRKGTSFAQVLRSVKWIPREYRELVYIGERTNRLDEILAGAADSLESQIQNRLDAMLKLLEPALLIVMGSIVALFVFALIMPILRSSSLVG